MVRERIYRDLGGGGAAREGAEATESGRSRALSFGGRQHFILRAKGAPDD